MMIIPNFGNRISSGIVPRGIDHHALLVSAPSSESYEMAEFPFNGFYRKRITIDGSYYQPPKELISAMIAKSWTLNLSLNFGAASLSETNLALEYSTGSCDSIAEKASSLSSAISYSDFNSSGTDSISCSIDIGALAAIEWDWTLNKWTVPLDMMISCGGDEVSGIFRLGRSTTAFGASLSGVSINLLGGVYYAFENGNPASDAFPTGSITLEPIDYLPLVAPP